MERLVTTAQAAQILGLSLQGVHYRIKKNQLKSLKKSGKTYVYISDYVEEKPKEEAKVELTDAIPKNTVKLIVKSKDEQISLLKKSIKWIRRQHIEEIERLEKNHKSIIAVFDREIELLQSAFNEMRAIYKPQIEQQNPSENPYSSSQVFKKDEKVKFMSIQDFTLYLKRHDKSEKDIKLIILKAIQKQDFRFIYNKKDKKLLILNEDFSDLV